MTDDLEKYMNDPDIIDEPMSLRYIHAVRFKIYEETKNMTPEEHTAYIKKKTDPIIKKFKLTHLLKNEP
jgi:hypothetical protein